MDANLYVHFPFCRTRCSYCTLYSRTGLSASARENYSAQIAREIAQCPRLNTVYFGGGSPALCDLSSVCGALQEKLVNGYEFTVELHPLDVTDDTLAVLKRGGVNRISMGVQSLNDQTLSAMNRGYTCTEAETSFKKIKQYFENAGIDLIVGYPGETEDDIRKLAQLQSWGLTHCSVYALQNERKLKNAIDDETTLKRISIAAEVLSGMGLKRYEISNYALPGRECQHNLAVWRGEDYLGLGAGAFGRVGLKRTHGVAQGEGYTIKTELVDARQDKLERTLFRLRTIEGLTLREFPEWERTLDKFTSEGLLTKSGDAYVLTPRGTEVCDSILAELI